MNILKIIFTIVLIIGAIFLSFWLYSVAFSVNSVLGLAMGAVLVCGWAGAIFLGILEFIAWRR